MTDITAAFVPVFALCSCCIATAQAKLCIYTNSAGYSRNYMCSPFEYCCQSGCCENFPAFYRVWYFWLCLMLALMFCSGGGYWYRRHFYQQRNIFMHVGASPQSSTTMVVMNSIHNNNNYNNYNRHEIRPSLLAGGRSRLAARAASQLPCVSSSSRSPAAVIPLSWNEQEMIDMSPTRGHPPLALRGIGGGAGFEPPSHPRECAELPPSYFETVYTLPPPSYSVVMTPSPTVLDRST